MAIGSTGPLAAASDRGRQHLGGTGCWIIDTTTPGGRLIFHVFGALGQFELDLIRDRTKAGLAAAAARGRKGGRKPVVTDDKLKRGGEHLANGLNVLETAARIKVSKTALYAAFKASQPDAPNHSATDS